MATMKLTATVRTALADALLAAFDGGDGPCVLRFYDGSQPAGPGTAVGAQVLLGSVVCADPVGTTASGVLTFDAMTQDDAADATGTATWARLVDGDGNAVADFDVSDTGGTGAIKLNTVSIVVGGPIVVSSFVITLGGA